MPSIAPFLLALPLAGQDAQDAPAFAIAPELLADAVAAARPAVERALGYGIPEGFAGARTAETAEVRDVIVRENLPLMLAQTGDAEQARIQARSFARGLAPALLAKYAQEEREILVSPEAFQLNAELLGQPELLREDVVRALVVHELVHAADVPHHAFFERCEALADAQRIQTLNAVLEGHAQHVARKVCAELGSRILPRRTRRGRKHRRRAELRAGTAVRPPPPR